MTQEVDMRRVYPLNQKPVGEGPVVYWMSRDQRARDNWALLYASQIARRQHQPLLVVFCLSPNFLGATARQYGFMLKGLAETAGDLEKLGIPFFLLTGDPSGEIVRFCKKAKAGAVVTEFDPLRIKITWRTQAATAVSCALFEVDAHNIVPCRIVSQKQEYGAYTLRPKIHRLLPEFLTGFPRLAGQRRPAFGSGYGASWSEAKKNVRANRHVAEVDWCLPGEEEAARALRQFVREKLPQYEHDRNNPVLSGQSNLSPYLHFGQLSAQRAALAVKAAEIAPGQGEAFLEELVVRRELSDNFCFYNAQYDSVKGFPAWAAKTLGEHAGDAREYVYTAAQFERGATHDELWNAAQMHMVTSGKMHGYLRMYWAKKILEWTKTPAEAMRIAIYLNDTYELDGRDPNGYAGIAWSIGGVHDRAWFERPVFGKIRFMSYNGCRSKFDVAEYIRRHEKKHNPA